ncbi:MAG: serine hydrolase [Gemmatimonadota bacterium]|nr:serine hydrolase [Gemmatimonadota bacterium]
MRTVRPPLATVVAAAALLAAACGTSDEPTTPVAPPTPTATVHVTPATASVEVGDTIRFTATVTGANGQPVANPAVTWSTSEAGQAWAREDGLVTGAGPGTPTVTATSQGATGTATLTVTASPISALLLGVRVRHGLIGLAGAIVTSERLVAVGAAGTRAHGSLVPVTIHDKWHLGSITKSMTSTLAGILVQDGALEWTTTLEAAFPDFPNIHPDLRPVPIEPILAHRGGFTNEIGQFATWTQMLTSTDALPAQRRAFAMEVLGTAPEFPPLQTHHYSNVGYMIAGAALEAVTGQQWEALIRTRLFAPLGMDDTGFGAPGVPNAMDQPRGHLGQGTGRFALEPGDPRADNPPGLGPAGTVHATMQDLGRYVAMHLAGEQGRADLLQPETIQRLHTPAEGFTYASGWVVTNREWAGGRALAHSGSNLRWYAVVWMAPERDFAVLVATNQGGETAFEATDEAAWRLIQLHLAS